MSWHDDSWRDSYDAWKLRSPDDEYPEPACDHEDFEIDLAHLAHCSRCHATWNPTQLEILAYRCIEPLYDAHCRREERRDRWRERVCAAIAFTFPFRMRLFRWLEKRWPRTTFPLLDDEIPF